MSGWFWNRWWQIKCRAWRVQCWFIGHNECWGSWYDREPDYCDRCYMKWPQDAVTLPRLLNRAYGWTVERDWGWFERLDCWLMETERTRRLLPHWWSY